MKKNKGFTLIELLAVIIILAIIALIATPIVMRVIENSKKSAAERGAENYVRAVETQALALRGKGTTLDGTYGINSNGNLCPNNATTCNEEVEIKIDMSGKKPSSGSIVISNGKVVSTGTSLTIEDYTATINENGSAIATKVSGSSEQTSTQVYKPQYYGDGSFSGTVGSTNAPASPSTVPPTGKSFYLGYDVADGKVSAGYVCFIKNKNETPTEYCLKGYDTDAYATNQGVIEDAYEEIKDTDYCSFGDYNSNCDADGLAAIADLDGYVYVIARNDSAECRVYGYGGFECIDF